MVIIQVEDRFCKAAQVFSKLLDKVQCAAKRGDAVHEVEEMTWSDLIETGRQTVAAFIQGQKEDIPRPAEIGYEGSSCPFCGRNDQFRPNQEQFTSRLGKLRETN